MNLSEKIKELKGNTSYRKMSEKTNVSHNYLRNLITGIDPRTGKEIEPSADVLKRIAKAYPDKTTYVELLKLAGYLDDDNSKENISIGEKEKKYYELTDKEKNDIALQAEKLMDGIENGENLNYYGEPSTKEQRDRLLLAIRTAMEMNKEEAKKKFTRKDLRDSNSK